MKSLRQGYGGKAPIVPHSRSATIKNRSGAEGDYCDSVNAASGSLIPIYVQILTLQIKPVSIVGCCTACSETTFFLELIGYVGLPPKPAWGLVPRPLLRFARF